MSAASLTVLDRALDYTYKQSQERARTCEEHEDFAITLRLIGLLCDDWSTGPGLFNVACAYATGLPHAKYLRRRAERAAFMRNEYERTIPDFDPTLGREPYGPQFRNLGSEESEGFDSGPARMSAAEYKAACVRFGSRPAKANDGHPAPPRLP
jgi:hypothetical protein